MKKIVASILAAVLALSMLSGCGSADSGVTEDGYAKELYLYNWSEYMPEEILTAFEDEYGIRVVQSTFTSNEELLTKLTAAVPSQYDLIVPTNFIVEALVAQNLVQPLDLNNIPNLQNINPQMLDLDFDKGNQYTVPYMATITAAVVNQKKLEELGVEMPTSMDDFLNPAFENNLVVMDDSRGLIGFALSRSGRASMRPTRIPSTAPWNGWNSSNPTSRHSIPTAPRPCSSPMRWQAALSTAAMPRQPLRKIPTL